MTTFGGGRKEIFMCKNVKQNVLFEQSEFTFCSFCMYKSRPGTKSEDASPKRRGRGSGPSTSSGTEKERQAQGPKRSNKRPLTFDLRLVTLSRLDDAMKMLQSYNKALIDSNLNTLIKSKLIVYIGIFFTFAIYKLWKYEQERTFYRSYRCWSAKKQRATRHQPSYPTQRNSMVETLFRKV